MRVKLWIISLFHWICLCTCQPMLEADGCQHGWVLYEDYCYLYAHAVEGIHYESARAVCEIKDATLVSLWGHDELNFVTNRVQKILPNESRAWIGVECRQMNAQRCVWLDGSGQVEIVDIEHMAETATDDICASMTTYKSLQLISCDTTLPVFICKKPINKLYLPNIRNVTNKYMHITKDPYETIFERMWPPVLEDIDMDLTSSYHLAAVEVFQETECAYMCYTLDECQAFIVTCKSSNKCHMRVCRLLAGVEML